MKISQQSERNVMRLTLLLTHDYSRSTVCRFSRFKKVYLREGERADGLPGRLDTGTITKTPDRPTVKHIRSTPGVVLWEKSYAHSPMFVFFALHGITIFKG